MTTPALPFYMSRSIATRETLIVFQSALASYRSINCVLAGLDIGAIRSYDSYSWRER